MIRAGMGPYPHRVALAPRTPGWGSTPWRAVSARGITVFVPGLLELSLYRILSDPGMGRYPHLMALALRTPGWGSRTVGGGIDQGDYCFCPRFDKVVDLWKDF